MDDEFSFWEISALKGETL